MINHDLLDMLVPKTILPIHIKHIASSSDPDMPMSQYNSMHDSPDANVLDQIDTLESILILDVDVHVSPSKLKAAAICHLTTKGTGILQITCNHDPECDFGNFNIFPKMFPSLFPYGIRAMEDPNQQKKISFHTHIKYLL